MNPKTAEVAGSPRYWAWLYSPPRTRAVLEAVLDVEAEIRSVLAPGLEHQVAHVRLEWWHDECARYAQGTPSHPLTRTLRTALDSTPASASRAGSDGATRPRLSAQPEGLVDTTVWDLAAATFETQDELAAYCERWAEAVTRTIALGASQQAPAQLEEVEYFGRSAGAALKELELLETLVTDARCGRLRLPLDALERGGIDTAALAHPPWPPALCAVLQGRHQAARAALARSLIALPMRHQPMLRGLIVWVAVAAQRSRLAERALPRPVQPSAFERLREVGLAWRTARQAEQGRFQLQSAENPS